MGGDAEDTYSARAILKNGVASDLSLSDILDDNISERDLWLTVAPSLDELNKLEPIYLSYFTEWNSYTNYIFAKKYGFHDLTGEWDRTMTAENFDQVDSVGSLVHAWMKYPKFGHALSTDYTSRFIRYGMMTRDEAIEIVKKKDHNLDPRCVQDFCDFLGYSETEFWSIVDTFYNTDIFEKNKHGEWVFKIPLS